MVTVRKGTLVSYLDRSKGKFPDSVLLVSKNTHKRRFCAVYGCFSLYDIMKRDRVFSIWDVVFLKIPRPHLSDLNDLPGIDLIWIFDLIQLLQFFYRRLVFLRDPA